MEAGSRHSMAATSDPVFDEEWYLARYPDVARVVRSGAALTAKTHYIVHGRKEGRSGYRFDKDWYTHTYPVVTRDIAQGRAADPQDHYERYGRFRGYLPYSGASRSKGPDQQHPHLAGLWIDLPNAHDIVAGRQEAGLITAAQAMLLLEFIDCGFVVLRSAIPSEIIDRARYDLAKIYLGCCSTLLFDACPGFPGSTSWRPGHNDGAAAALDVHRLCPAIRALIFSQQVVSFLQLLFDSRPIVYASAGYLRGSGRPHARDAMRWPTSRPRQSAGGWFALETVRPGAGAPGCRPGSHRLDNPAIGGDRGAVVGTTHGGQTVPSLPMQVLSLDRGDAVIWHAGLWHGEQTVASPLLLRRSITAQYCPSHVAPLSWETMPTELIEYDDLGFYTADRG
jgi:Phytanoyl-CoA dioxygenase (PhyH)